jgi:hypothetical protein
VQVLPPQQVKCDKIAKSRHTPPATIAFAWSLSLRALVFYAANQFDSVRLYHPIDTGAFV